MAEISLDNLGIKNIFDAWFGRGDSYAKNLAMNVIRGAAQAALLGAVPDIDVDVDVLGVTLDDNPSDPSVTLKFEGSLDIDAVWDVDNPHPIPDIHEEVELVDTSTEISVKYSLLSGDYDASLRIEFGRWGAIDIDEEKLSDILDVQLNDLLTLIPNFGIVGRDIHSNYDELKEEYEDKYGGPANVYFASVQFVRWASYGTLGEEIIKSIVSGGATFEHTMSRAKDEALNELGNVAEWLRSRGVGEFEGIATQLLSGESVSGLPNLKTVWQPVTYWSTLTVGSRKVVEDFLPNDHAGFVFVWTSDTVDRFEPSTVQKTESPNPPDGRRKEPRPLLPGEIVGEDIDGIGEIHEL